MLLAHQCGLSVNTSKEQGGSVAVKEDLCVGRSPVHMGITEVMDESSSLVTDQLELS